MSRGPPQPRPDYNSHQRWRGLFRVPGRKSLPPPGRSPPSLSGPASRAQPCVSAGLERVPLQGLIAAARGSRGRSANPRRDPGAGPNGGRPQRAQAGLPPESRTCGRACSSGVAEEAGLGRRGSAYGRASRSASASGSMRNGGLRCPLRARPALPCASKETGRVRAEPGTKSSLGSGLPPAHPATACCHALLFAISLPIFCFFREFSLKISYS